MHLARLLICWRPGIWRKNIVWVTSIQCLMFSWIPVWFDVQNITYPNFWHFIVSRFSALLWWYDNSPHIAIGIDSMNELGDVYCMCKTWNTRKEHCLNYNPLICTGGFIWVFFFPSQNRFHLFHDRYLHVHIIATVLFWYLLQSILFCLVAWLDE